MAFRLQSTREQLDCTMNSLFVLKDRHCSQHRHRDSPHNSYTRLHSSHVRLHRVYNSTALRANVVAPSTVQQMTLANHTEVQPPQPPTMYNKGRTGELQVHLVLTPAKHHQKCYWLCIWYTSHATVGRAEAAIGRLTALKCDRHPRQASQRSVSVSAWLANPTGHAITVEFRSCSAKGSHIMHFITKTSPQRQFNISALVTTPLFAK